MNKYQNIIQKISSVIPSKLLINGVDMKIILPFYHTISNNKLAHIKHLYQLKNEKQFINDLDYLLKYYQPINYLQLKKHFYKEKIITKKSFFLSFDDGLSECYDIIAPILKKKGIPATFFLNSHFIDNKSLFYRYKISLIIEEIINNSKNKNKLLNYIQKDNHLNINIFDWLKQIKYSDKNKLNEIAELINLDFNEFLKKEKPYLTTVQINKLIADGFSIGCHSVNHPEYKKLSLKEQVEQTNNSSDFICKKFNLNYKIFAFPFTDAKVSKTFFNIIFKNNFELTFGTFGLKHHFSEKNIERIPMEISNLKAKNIIKYEYFYYFLKSFFGKNNIKM